MYGRLALALSLAVAALTSPAANNNLINFNYCFDAGEAAGGGMLNTDRHRIYCVSDDSQNFEYGSVSDAAGDECVVYSQPPVGMKVEYWLASGSQLDVYNDVESARVVAGASEYHVQYSSQYSVQNPIYVGARFCYISYGLKFDSNGGSGNMLPLSGIVYTNEFALATNTLAKTGHSFSGWKTPDGEDLADCETVSGSRFGVVDDGTNITLTAQWTANAYDVTLDPDGGSGGAAAVSATYGSDMPAVVLPTRSGYNFGGYYTQKDGEGTQYYAEDGSSARTWDQTDAATLYAKWTEIPVVAMCKVQFDANGGEKVMPDQNVVCESPTALTSNVFTRVGYTFYRWYSPVLTAYYEDGAAVYFTKERSGQTIPFRAEWKPISYTVAFDANGGHGTMVGQAFDYDTPQELSGCTFEPPYPGADFWAFAGWSNTAANVFYEPGKAVSNLTSEAGGTVTLTAVWRDIRTEISRAMHCSNLNWTNVIIEETSPFKKEWRPLYGPGIGYDSDSCVTNTYSLVNLVANVVTNGTLSFYCKCTGTTADSATLVLEQVSSFGGDGTKTNLVVATESSGAGWQKFSVDVVASPGAANWWVMIHREWANNDLNAVVYIDRMTWTPEGGGEEPSGDESKPISGATVTLGDPLVYTGAEQTQTVASVIYEGLPATYVVSGNTATNAGEYTLTITGTGDFTGTVARAFTIAKATYDMGAAKWDYAGAFTYDGTEKTVSVTNLPNGVEVTGCTGNSATNAGTYNAHATLGYDAANYEAPALPDLDWSILPRALTEAMVGQVADQTYTGAAIKPVPDVEDADLGAVLSVGTDFSLAYADNVKVGTATVTVTGIGNYSNCVIRTFSIVSGGVEPVTKLVGTGKVTTPKTWKTGQKVTWKATADKGSVFAHWEGQLVDSLGVTTNELRNPSLAFQVPEGFETNQVTAVFIPIDDDGLSELGITQTKFGFKEAVSNVWVSDNSKSYVTATVSGLPTGLKFDAKKLAITGAPTKSGVFWAQVKAKNASGYQWAENFNITVEGEGKKANEPKLVRTPYHPLTVICATEGGTATGTGVYADGKKASISAKPAKGYSFAGWYRDEALSEPMEFVSGDFRKASQSVVIPEARYLYARFVASTLDADPIVGLAAKGAGFVVDEDCFAWRVGVAVPEGDGVEYESASLPSATAAKLPAGVKFDAAKGCFTGVPTKAGTYEATVTVKNASKSSSVLKLSIKVAALDAWAQGAFNGGVESESGESVGIASLTVAANGKISGKLLKGGLTWTLSAASYASYESEVYYATVIGKNGKLLATNELTVVKGEFDELGGMAELKGDSGSSDLCQNKWKVEPWKTVGRRIAKLKELKFYVVGGEVLDELPSGVDAYDVLTIKLAAAGTATVKGAFTTGEKNGRPVVHNATCASVLIPTTVPVGADGKFDGIVDVYFAPALAKNFPGFAASVSLQGL